MNKCFLLISIVCISFQAFAQNKHPEDDVYSKTQVSTTGISGYFKVPVKRETDYKDDQGNYVVPAYYHLYNDEDEKRFYNFIKLNITVREVYLRITINDADGELLEAWKGKINWGQGRGISIARLKPGVTYYVNFYTENNKLVYSQAFQRSVRP